MDTKQILQEICKVLEEKKAADITVINVAPLTIVAEFFIIASANSNTAVKALTGAVEEKLEDGNGLRALRVEGQKEGRWVAMDYGSVIVHIFHHETRQFYQLERLWTDGGNAIKYPEDSLQDVY